MSMMMTTYSREGHEQREMNKDVHVDLSRGEIIGG